MTLEARDLRVHVRDRLLVDVPALTVPAGSATAILGPNGAGKSTLLRALGMLSRHQVTGEVLLDGAPLTPARSRASVAAVLQRPVLRRGTVIDNATDGLRFRGVDRRSARARVAPWLEALGVARLAGRDVRSLSGGEAQRVCLVRALAVEPRMLLLDEPFTGLDSATRVDLLADLRAALDQRSAATVLVTHHRGDAHALTDSTVLLVDGQVRNVGPTADALDHPVDADTARLLGFTNLLPPGLSSRSGTLAARPEDCRIIDPDPERPVTDASVTLRGTLSRAVILGDVVRIDIDTPSGTLTCLQPVGTAPPPTGTTVTVHVTSTRELGDAARALTSRPRPWQLRTPS